MIWRRHAVALLALAIMFAQHACDHIIPLLPPPPAVPVTA